jgi:hypothetical protein
MPPVLSITRRSKRYVPVRFSSQNAFGMEGFEGHRVEKVRRADAFIVD